MKFESSEKHVSGIFGELKAEVQLDMGISDFNRKRKTGRNFKRAGRNRASLPICVDTTNR
jgi:hypothetical protein